MTTHLCLRCRFHPASERIYGYCSWDCHDADADADSDLDAYPPAYAAAPHDQHQQNQDRPSDERGVAA